MTVKVVKTFSPRSVGSGSVSRCEVKDTFGNNTVISVWNELIRKVVVDKVLKFENLRVEKYPYVKPHYIKTIAGTTITDLTADLKEEFKNISLIDGQIIGTVEVFHEVYCYFSCENCTCSIDEDATYCPKCKKNTNSKKDFKYEVLIKMENGKCDGGVGFRQSLSMEGIEVDSNAEMLEDDLNENFAGRKAIMDFNINKKDGKKMVFSLKFE